MADAKKNYILIEFSTDKSLYIVQDQDILSPNNYAIGDNAVIKWPASTCLKTNARTNKLKKEYTVSVLDISNNKLYLEEKINSLITESDSEGEKGRGKRCKASRKMDDEDDAQLDIFNKKMKKKVDKPRKEAIVAKNIFQQLGIGTLNSSSDDIQKAGNSNENDAHEAGSSNENDDHEAGNNNNVATAGNSNDLDVGEIKKENTELRMENAELRTENKDLKNKMAMLEEEILISRDLTQYLKQAKKLACRLSIVNYAQGNMSKDQLQDVSNFAPGSNEKETCDLLPTKVDMVPPPAPVPPFEPQHPHLLWSSHSNQVVELTSNSGIFIDNLSRIALPMNCRSATALARALMDKVFTQQALLSCSVKGGIAKGIGKPKEQREGLYPVAIQAITDFVLNLRAEKGWVKDSEYKDLIRGNKNL